MNKRISLMPDKSTKRLKHGVFLLSFQQSNDHMIALSIGGFNSVVMLIDSGAEINVLSEIDWVRIHQSYENGDVVLYNVTSKTQCRPFAFGSSTPLKVLASFAAWTEVVMASKPRALATFYVVAKAGRSLLGRKTAIIMGVLSLGIGVSVGQGSGSDINAIGVTQPFPAIPDFEAVFDIDHTIAPTKNAYYHVPAAFSERASARLEEMEHKDIIERVYDAPRWISGMSAVPKGGSDFRLVVNMRGPNKAIRRQYHRLPVMDDIKLKLHGSTCFTKLDLQSAFYHIRLAEQSRELTTFMADKGMYRFKRLNFGVNSAPEIFQSAMEKVFSGVEGVIIFLDDILVYGSSKQETQLRSEKVMERVEANNLTLNQAKCEHLKDELVFLGQNLSADGFKIDQGKVDSVKSFRQPTTASELKSFLGLASYLSTYLPSFGDLTAPLWDATTKNGFFWGKDQEEAFQNTKTAIVNCTLGLGFFSNNDSTTLYTDASPRALGAVLTQTNERGESRIISFASKALSPTEQRYSQPQREALAIVWAIEHFFFYLMGRHFVVRTDALGIAFIVNRERETSRRAMSRADGWALRLSAFDFTVEYIKGNFNIADPSSRLAPGTEGEFVEKINSGELGCFSAEITTIDFSGEEISLRQVTEATEGDVQLAVAKEAISRQQWPNDKEEMGAYWAVRESLTVTSGVVARNGSVVLPDSLRQKALRLAHIGHPGMGAMKSILRSRVWWPGMKADVEIFVKECLSCTVMAQPEKPAPMLRSILPSEPWERLAIDFNGPHMKFGGVYILLVVDYFSRMLFAAVIPATDFVSVKKVLDRLFEKYGKPRSVRNDNGPPFNGREYAEYLESRDIEIQFSTPLFPQQNGMVERYMKVVNKAVQIAVLNGTGLEGELFAAIRAHNRAKHSVTQRIPEELMWGRKIRRGLPLLGVARTEINQGELKQRDLQSKTRAKAREDLKRGAKTPAIAPGDTVVVLKTNRIKGDPKYDPQQYKVMSQDRGDFLLASADGKIKSRNITHLKRVQASGGTSGMGHDDDQGQVCETEDVDPELMPPSIQSRRRAKADGTPEPLRRSTRVKVPPKHFDMYVRLIELEKL